jgi:hypothetical protein
MSKFTTLYESDILGVTKAVGTEVYYVTLYRYDGVFGRKTLSKKRFYGESGWSDAERFAYDHDRDAIGCTEVTA